ncbi:hypothetical protein DDQ41_03710 [Streptomyces spongiicola]|uniref:Transcriptional regulator WhiB n=1 Tax=Streptomyces spongiicola TaxID=1690221 RepID=A0ABM6V381_9ACTN|nr:WhiB family transcriptional regulator [Streptomyces spongiicola]AWK08188.1 hypothetical protein DDQ41_03710 [Streptomyces spongiicola]
MLYDPERRWLDRALCRTVHPDKFFAPNGSQLGRKPADVTQSIWDDAKAICRRCPVLEECRRDTKGEEYGVWGGVDEYERHRARERLAKGSWKRWPEGTPQGVGWPDIRHGRSRGVTARGENRRHRGQRWPAQRQ